MDPLAQMLAVVTVFGLIGAALKPIRPFMNRNWLRRRMATTAALHAWSGLSASLLVWRIVATQWPGAFWLPVPLVAAAAAGVVVYGFRTEPTWRSVRRKGRHQKAR